MPGRVRDLIENDSHSKRDKAIVDRLPLESPSSSVSPLVTLATRGIAPLNSNGLFHGMGDHAENFIFP